jgi:hypothetical protein
MTARPANRDVARTAPEQVCADMALGALRALVPPKAQPGLVAAIVQPIAPNLAALRRVSSNVERAYVSTSSPCLMLV